MSNVSHQCLKCGGSWSARLGDDRRCPHCHPRAVMTETKWRYVCTNCGLQRKSPALNPCPGAGLEDCGELTLTRQPDYDKCINCGTIRPHGTPDCPTCTTKAAFKSLLKEDHGEWYTGCAGCGVPGWQSGEDRCNDCGQQGTRLYTRGGGKERNSHKLGLPRGLVTDGRFGGLQEASDGRGGPRETFTLKCQKHEHEKYTGHPNAACPGKVVDEHGRERSCHDRGYKVVVYPDETTDHITIDASTKAVIEPSAMGNHLGMYTGCASCGRPGHQEDGPCIGCGITAGTSLWDDDGTKRSGLGMPVQAGVRVTCQKCGAQKPRLHPRNPCKRKPKGKSWKGKPCGHRGYVIEKGRHAKPKPSSGTTAIPYTATLLPPEEEAEDRVYYTGCGGCSKAGLPTEAQPCSNCGGVHPCFYSEYLDPMGALTTLKVDLRHINMNNGEYRVECQKCGGAKGKSNMASPCEKDTGSWAAQGPEPCGETAYRIVVYGDKRQSDDGRQSKNERGAASGVGVSRPKIALTRARGESDNSFRQRIEQMAGIRTERTPAEKWLLKEGKSICFGRPQDTRKGRKKQVWIAGSLPKTDTTTTLVPPLQGAVEEIVYRMGGLPNNEVIPVVTALTETQIIWLGQRGLTVIEPTRGRGSSHKKPWHFKCQHKPTPGGYVYHGTLDGICQQLGGPPATDNRKLSTPVEKWLLAHKATIRFMRVDTTRSETGKPVAVKVQTGKNNHYTHESHHEYEDALEYAVDFLSELIRDEAAGHRTGFGGAHGALKGPRALSRDQAAHLATISAIIKCEGEKFTLVDAATGINTKAPTLGILAVMSGAPPVLGDNPLGGEYMEISDNPGPEYSDALDDFQARRKRRKEQAKRARRELSPTDGSVEEMLIADKAPPAPSEDDLNLEILDASRSLAKRRAIESAAYRRGGKPSP